MPYKVSDYTIVIAVIAAMCWPKRMIFGAETHHGSRVLSAFIFPSIAIARAPHFNVHWQYSS